MWVWEGCVSQVVKRHVMINFLQQTLLDTNPYLLGLTVAVSILHSVFEFLAFKNGVYQCCYGGVTVSYRRCVMVWSNSAVS